MPTRPRRQGASGGGRERLLAAATRLFGAKGYAATSVREILNAADVTAPVLYYHFGNKEGLFIGLLRDGFALLDAEGARAVAGAGTATEKVRAFCGALVAVRQRYGDVMWLVDALLAAPAQAAPRFDFKGEFARVVQRLAPLVRAGIEDGEFRPCNPTAAALVLLGAVRMTPQLELIRARLPESAPLPEAVVETALAGLRVSSPTTSSKARQRRTRRPAD
jgi:TetR/AcrR family transcriptional regulator